MGERARFLGAQVFTGRRKKLQTTSWMDSMVSADSFACWYLVWWLWWWLRKMGVSFRRSRFPEGSDLVASSGGGVGKMSSRLRIPKSWVSRSTSLLDRPLLVSAFSKHGCLVSLDLVSLDPHQRVEKGVLGGGGLHVNLTRSMVPKDGCLVSTSRFDVSFRRKMGVSFRRSRFDEPNTPAAG